MAWTKAKDNRCLWWQEHAGTRSAKAGSAGGAWAMALTWFHPSAAAGPRCMHPSSLLALLHASSAQRGLGETSSLTVMSSNSSLSLALPGREDSSTRTNAALLTAQTRPPGTKARQELPRRSLLHFLGIPDSTGQRADRSSPKIRSQYLLSSRIKQECFHSHVF